MHMFYAPARVHKLAGEPIEQLGMRRRFGLHAEVLRRGDNAVAEIGLPHTIHEYARGGRRFRIGDPFRQGEARVIRAGRQRMQECWGARFHGPGRLEPADIAKPP